jgi:hypothetical protein
MGFCGVKIGFARKLYYSIQIIIYLGLCMVILPLQTSIEIIFVSIWDLWWTKWHWDGFILRELWLSSVSIIPPVLHTHLFVYHRRYIVSATNGVVKQHT